MCWIINRGGFGWKLPHRAAQGKRKKTIRLPCLDTPRKQRGAGPVSESPRKQASEEIIPKKKKRNVRGWQLAAVILFAATGFVQQVGVTATQVGQAATKVDHAIGAVCLLN